MLSKILDVDSDCESLVEAYLGFYEGVLENIPEADRHAWVRRKVLSDSPSERVRVFCEWNGIINFHTHIYRYATSAIIAL